MNVTSAPYCRRHTTRPALWNCPGCGLELCTRCKPYAELLPEEVSCPLCHGPMVENRPEAPLSQRLLSLALSPARPATIALMVALAVISGMVWLGWAQVLLSVPLLLLVSAWMVTLSRHVAENQPGSPAPADMLEHRQKNYTLQTFWFSMPVLLILGLAGWWGSAPIFAIGLTLCAAALPAILAASIMKGQAVKAFDAVLLKQIIEVFRQDYLSVFALAFSALCLLSFAARLAGPSGMLLSFIGAWLLMVLAHQTGKLLYRHRRMLDYPAGVDPADRPQAPAAGIYKPAQLLADADTLNDAGQLKSARLQLGDALTRYPDDPDLNRRFDELIRKSSGRAKFLNHLERRLRRLVHKGQSSGAADLWQYHSASLDNWMPCSKDTRYRLALELDQRGEHSTAFRMLIGLTPGEPGFNHQAEAWLEAARILDEHLGNSSRARELRTIVMQRYPQQARRWMARWQAAAAGSAQSA